MYATVVTVDLDTACTDEAQQQLHEVTIPAVKAQEGFVR